MGTGTTTDIHRVRCSGFGGCASRLARLPNAQPRPPTSTSRKGSTEAAWARETPTSTMPATAIPIPSHWRPRTASPSRRAPRASVNGAEAWRTSDDNPVGIPASMPQ